jgi:pimeloyl-ACP methyl ester carboxylesterase
MNQAVQNWLNQGQFLDFESHQIFYLQKGQGQNLLILHGYPYNTFEWEATIEELAKTYRITTFDLLGMGFSDKPKAYKYSFEEHSAIVNALLKHLKISETHILSHDLGVSVVQELLARDLESKNNFKILSSAFINGGLFMDAYKPRFIQRLLSQTPNFIGKFISQKISKKSVNQSVKSVFGINTQPSDEVLDKQWEILNHKDGKSITYLIGRLVFDKYKYQSRWITAMQQTTIPLCYICGPADPNSGLHMAKRYEELIPNPKVYLLREDIGHWGFLEDETGVLEAFDKFISNI